MVVQPVPTHKLKIKDDEGSRQFTLKDATYSIGRSPGCDIQLFSLFVSRRQATLEKGRHEDGSYYYQIIDGDLQGKPSCNGLLVNGRKIKAHILEDKDEIVFAPQVSAIYYLERELIDEFDITLINPNMVGE
ncbi:MAG: FHA domain-containing protein [Symploca sp. SIO2E9]|nr:FHA domain-containing protein [Symploca sp. SIO2E9]